MVSAEPAEKLVSAEESEEKVDPEVKLAPLFPEAPEAALIPTAATWKAAWPRVTPAGIPCPARITATLSPTFPA